jgi:hypothetical protein
MPSSMSRWSAAAALLYWLLGIACAALLLRWAAQPGPLAPSDGQLTRQRASGLIYGEERLAQVVAVPRDGLAAVQFWMLVHRRDEPGNVVLRVAALDAPEMPLAIIAIPLRDMPAAPPVTFPLPPFDRATTPSLLLTLEAPELDRDHAPSVLGADNLYGSGLISPFSCYRAPSRAIGCCPFRASPAAGPGRLAGRRSTCCCRSPFSGWARGWSAGSSARWRAAGSPS